jgi:spermidine synthase
VVEIDPELTQMARDHFRLEDNPRMRIFHEDARTYLNKSTEKYDVIYGDAYKSLYTIPWHLTTKEAAEKTYSMLNENGCVLLNIISSLQGNSSLFLQAELATYRSVFPQVFVFAVMDPANPAIVQSTLLIALKSTIKPVWESGDAQLAEYLRHEVTDQVAVNLPVLTDEFAPVDYYTNKAIK